MSRLQIICCLNNTFECINTINFGKHEVAAYFTEMLQQTQMIDRSSDLLAYLTMTTLWKKSAQIFLSSILFNWYTCPF